VAYPFNKIVVEVIIPRTVYGVEGMSDDLVKRLRSNRPIPTLPHEAADRIEAQAAEIKRLREALREAAEDPDSIGGSIARAALAGKAEQ